MADFGLAAKGLGKNPIGVVALFLVLLYGLASLLFGTTGRLLTEQQRWPFIWFLVVFPLVILCAFLFLVVRHHEKLYAPSEYRDERNFFRQSSPEVQRHRLDEEVQALQTAATNAAESNNQYRPLAPEEVRQTVSLAEDLGLRALQAELGSSISREVGVEVDGDGWVNFDGAVARGDELIAIEIKPFRGGGFAIHQIEHLLELVSKKIFRRFRRVSLILAIVSEASLTADRELEKELHAVIARYSVPASLRFFRL